ncbi:MAG: DUF4270 family protein [Bacteroidota bacterium]
MMQKLPALVAISMLILGLWTACTKPTPFGASLLSGEIADYDYTDTMTVVCTLQREDSTQTSDRSSTVPYFLCGNLNDPIFGHSSSEIYSLLQLGVLNPGFNPTIHKLDSIVLYLRFNASGFYGDTLQAQDLHVYRLDDPIAPDKSYYSTQTIASGTEIGSLQNFYPKPNRRDSLFSTTAKGAFIRVPLSNAFGNEILALDSLKLTDDTLFYKALRGIKITSNPSNSGSLGAIMAFNLNDASFSMVRMYYTEHDTTKRTYSMFFQGCNKFTHFTQNYTGTAPGQQIGKVSPDLMYAQGMNGLRMKIEIPYANFLDHIAVNDARLVLTAASVPGDNALLKPADQLVFTESSGDTLYLFSSDVNYSLTPTGTGGFDVFGGIPLDETDNGVALTRYRLALSQRLQDMVDETTGDIKKKTIYLNVYPQNRSARRAIFYGPKSATYPAKIALKYTRL